MAGKFTRRRSDNAKVHTGAFKVPEFTQARSYGGKVYRADIHVPKFREGGRIESKFMEEFKGDRHPGSRKARVSQTRVKR